MYRWETNLATMADDRRRLLAHASEGDMQAANQLRGKTTNALVFAIMSVRNFVHRNEEIYEYYLEGGYGDRKIYGLPGHVRAAESADAWMDEHYSMNLLADEKGWKLTDALCDPKTKCFGLGPAKATFAAALMGFSHSPCLDTHISRQLGISPEFPNIQAYREACQRTGCVTTHDQWSRFMNTPTIFPVTQHDIYFASQLGKKAVTAWVPRMPSTIVPPKKQGKK